MNDLTLTCAGGGDKTRISCLISVIYAFTSLWSSISVIKPPNITQTCLWHTFSLRCKSVNSSQTHLIVLRISAPQEKLINFKYCEHGMSNSDYLLCSEFDPCAYLALPLETWLQAVLTSASPKLLLHTAPQVLLWKTSNRPDSRSYPPVRRNLPSCATERLRERKIKWRNFQHSKLARAALYRY